jgi:hypothetical protein
MASMNRFGVTPHGFVEVFPGLRKREERNEKHGNVGEKGQGEERGDLVVEFNVVVQFEKITEEVKEELKRIV